MSNTLNVQRSERQLVIPLATVSSGKQHLCCGAVSTEYRLQEEGVQRWQKEVSLGAQG